MKIGIDIGGTNLAAGCVDDQGQLRIKKTLPTLPEEGYSAVLARLVTLIQALCDDLKQKGLPPADAIGIGVPGIVSPDGSVIYNCVNLYWENIPLKHDLETRCHLPVTIANDATVAGIAEHRFGGGTDTDNMVMLTLGTGIGGCVIINGRVVNGAHGTASEIGHMLTGPGLYPCNCGKRGCLETYASASSLIWQAKHAIAHGQPTMITRFCDGQLDALTAKMVMDAAKAGDTVGRDCFNTMIAHLATAISNITDLIDPERFILGGGLANAGDFLFDALRQAVDERFTFKNLSHPVIVPAQLQNDAGIIGAAFMDQYL